MLAPSRRLLPAFEEVRILDLTTTRARYGVDLLSQLGAEVRRPSHDADVCAAGIDDLDGATIVFADDESLIRRWVADADFQELMRRRGLILVGVTAFGVLAADGSTQESATREPGDVIPDLLVAAQSGFLSLTGYHDGGPMSVPYDHGYAVAGLFGALGASLALWHRRATGEGQFVDVSSQQAWSMGLENALSFFDLQNVVRTRTGEQDRFAATGVFECQDGQVLLMAGGVAGNQFFPNVGRWLADEGVRGVEALELHTWPVDYLGTDEAKQRFRDLFEPFARRHTREYLYRRAQHFDVPIGPVNTLAEAVLSPQLLDRGFTGPDPDDPERVTIVSGPLNIIPAQLEVRP